MRFHPHEIPRRKRNLQNLRHRPLFMLEIPLLKLPLLFAENHHQPHRRILKRKKNQPRNKQKNQIQKTQNDTFYFRQIAKIHNEQIHQQIQFTILL
jgi:hypothetical protein